MLCYGYYSLILIRMIGLRNCPLFLGCVLSAPCQLMLYCCSGGTLSTQTNIGTGSVMVLRKVTVHSQRAMPVVGYGLGLARRRDAVLMVLAFPALGWRGINHIIEQCPDGCLIAVCGSL